MTSTPPSDAGHATATTRLGMLHDAGVSIWLDTLSRELLLSGAFAALIADWSVTGATSNPTIFARAITGSDRYDEPLHSAVASGIRDPQELFLQLPGSRRSRSSPRSA
jgi:transaldolase